MGDVKRSDSKGDINNLLNDIRNVIGTNRATLDSLKAIKQKNDEVSKTKKRVDIPAIVSGKKKSEIDIPHKRSTNTGERESEIQRRSKASTKEGEEPPPTEPLYPLVTAGIAPGLESTPEVPEPKSDADPARRRDRRDRSRERKRRLETILNKSTTTTITTETTETHSSQVDRPRGRDPKPSRPMPSRDSYVSRKEETPTTPRTSASPRPTSPFSPRSASPRSRFASEPRSPASPMRSRNYSANSDNCSMHSHLYRIRRDSEGSVEIFPDYIEESHVVTEYQEPPAADRRATSPGRSLPRSSQLPATIAALRGAAADPRAFKRRIIVDKCPDCEDGDSPPEIEIRICKRDKCGKLRSETDISVLAGGSLNLRATPEPPNRSSSLNRIPQDRSDRGTSPARTPRRSPLPPSPSCLEVERMTRRLQLLRQEVDNVIKECNQDTVPLSISVHDRDPRSPSPYYPDKTPYYRARYHSAPSSPTGQNDKTTSTTELLTSRVYHPAEEEARNNHFHGTPREPSVEPHREPHKERPKKMTLSTHSLEVPVGSTPSWADQLQVEEVSIQEDAASPLVQQSFNNLEAASPAPIQHSYDQEFDPECDLSMSTHQIPPAGAPKREEELLTPPPLPPRSNQDITLRGDNLFDPFHIGTTYVVLSKQNHGRFKYQTPADPNSSAPPSPKPSTPLRTPKTTSSESSDQEPVALIKPVAVIPVNSATPQSLTSLGGSRRNLYVPKSLAGSMVSLQGDPGSSQPRSPTATEPRRKFNRPTKEPVYRELPVDCGVDAPPVINTRKPSLQELQLEQKNPASREYHLRSIADSEPIFHHSTSLRSMSPCSQNSLRRKMPYVKLLGEEWKELAQRLGYDNSHIAMLARDFPDPGQELLDHWSRQPDSKLDDLLYHLKFMGLWKTADTLDKTFDNTNV